MLDSAVLPTRLVHPSEREPLLIHVPVSRSRLRFVHVVWVFLAWLLGIAWLRVTRRLTGHANAVRFRLMLERLGGVWIKAGQWLSLRVDMFSPELTRELTSMLSSRVGFPFELVREIVEGELQRPIDLYFDEFEPEPFAADWVSQVHRAHLRREDVWVAVKVRRPDVHQTFERDLRIMERLARFLQTAGIYSALQWGATLAEFRQIVHEEIDFRFEASAIRRMRKSLPKQRVFVPELYSKYSSQRMLVTEFIHATLMADYITLQHTDPVRLTAWLQENEIEPRILAKRLIHWLLRSIFEDNFYHGDLYPGNIVLLRNNRIALLHFGSCTFTEREHLQKLRLFFRSLATRDYAKAADLSLLLCSTLPLTDVERVKEQVVRALRAWATRTFVKELPYAEKSIDAATTAVSARLFRHGITLDWEFLRIRRAIAILDASLMHVFPDANYTRLCAAYFRKADRRALVASASQPIISRALTTASKAMEIQDRLGEYTLFQSAIIRRHAQVFQGATDKVSYFLSVIVGAVAGAVLAFGAFLIAAFALQRRPGAAASLLGPQLTRVAASAPALDPQLWVIVMALVAYVAVVLLRLRRKLTRKKVWVPETQTAV